MPPPAMRAQVVESWYRSAAAGVRAETVDAPITLPEGALRDYREAHPLATVFPLLDDVLGQAARDCDTVMAVSDAEGQLLWVCGRPSVLRAAESIGFVEGSNWDERLAGTNAPGMALALDQPVSIRGSEHFRHNVQRWNCAAAPIHDPGSGSLLGVLDITGGQQVLVPQTMAMVRAAARMAESELGRQRLSTLDALGGPVPTGARASRPVRLAALGRTDALLTIGDATRPIRLSPRHSELLVLLASTPNGLSGDELAVLLYEEDSSSSTLRAELNRLRALLGDDLLASRPYRLTAEVAADWLAVEAVLARGDVAGALAGYRGPLLARSEAPGVARLREGLSSALREAVLRSGQLDLMSRWTRSGWGSEDYPMWQAQARLVQPTSPLGPLIAGQLARLDHDLG